MIEIFILPSIVLPIITFFIVMWLNKTNDYVLHFNRAEFLTTMCLMIAPIVNFVIFIHWIVIIIAVRSDKISLWFSKKPFCGE